MCRDERHDSGVLFVKRGRPQAGMFYVPESAWLGYEHNAVVSRGVCRRCAEAAVESGAACSRCYDLVGDRGALRTLVVSVVSVADGAGAKLTWDVEHLSQRAAPAAHHSVLERDLCWRCAASTAAAWVEGDEGDPLAPAVLTVPFQATAAEGSP